MKRKVLVTGASRGIGRAASIALASKGYDLLLLTAHSMDSLEELSAEIRNKYNVDVMTIQCDVGNQNDIEAIPKELFDDIYAVINNAAVSYVGLMTDMSCDEWNNLINVNLNSMFYISRKVIPGMIHRKEGRIINISSVWGNVGASMEVAYSASKGGVNSFTKALAKELAPSNISVNAVAFGVIDTDMNKCFGPDIMEELRHEIPADRIGTPNEAAEMIMSMLEAPLYMTGQIVTMDGGFT